MVLLPFICKKKCACRSYMSNDFRSSKGYMAQLMRIYIVTPEGPLRFSVNPLIQPAPHPCPTFHPGVGHEIDLSQGALWVLRLPYPLFRIGSMLFCLLGWLLHH